MKSTSSQSSLKQAVNRKLDEHQLSGEQLNDLHKLLNDSQTNTETAGKQRPWYLAAGAAMVAMIAILVVVFVPQQSLNMPQLIANEVVRNHLKLKPLEVSTNSLEEIRSHFDKLKFSPISSLNITDASSLIGGRYCSLQGYKAAQLRIVSSGSGKLDTVYQAPYVLDTFGKLPDIANDDSPLVVYERGIKVTIWVEKGILFARTHMEATQ